MTRALATIALGLFLLGIEVATGVVSLAAVRLWAGWQAVLSGDEFIVSMPRYFGGVTIMAGGIALYLGVFWAGLARHRIAGGEACPNCGTHTRRVRRRAWHRALSRTLDAQVTRRQCERCGWSGLVT